MSATPSQEFIGSWKRMAEICHQLSKDKGFWPGGVEASNPAEKIALIHAELSEALEEIRKEEVPPSQKIPQFSALEEEMADVVIRIMDFCEAYEIRLGAAVQHKHAYNKTRKHKHGKRF